MQELFTAFQSIAGASLLPILPYVKQTLITAVGGEGATAREVLRHKSVEKVVMVDIDKVGFSWIAESSAGLLRCTPLHTFAQAAAVQQASGRQARHCAGSCSKAPLPCRPSSCRVLLCRSDALASTAKDPDASGCLFHGSCCEGAWCWQLQSLCDVAMMGCCCNTATCSPRPLPAGGL